MKRFLALVGPLPFLALAIVVALRAHWTVDVVAGLAAAIAVGLLF